MRKQVKIASVVLMVVLLATMAAAAVQKPASQQTQTASQLVIGAQDVITASDAGGRRSLFERHDLDHFDRCRGRHPDPGPVIRRSRRGIRTHEGVLSEGEDAHS